MLKTIYLKIIATIFIGTFLSSCNSKKENFDIDLTNFKVPAKNKVKISFKEDLSFGVNDYKIEFKLKSNKVIDTIQSEKIITSEANVIKFDDKKKKYKKSFKKDTKRKYYKKYKKKSK